MSEIAKLTTRIGAPEAEVWIRLRQPTLLEAVGRELDSDDPLELSDQLVQALEWIVDRNADATWNHDSGDLREAAQQLVEMVAPVLEDGEEVARRIDTWAGEWSLT